MKKGLLTILASLFVLSACWGSSSSSSSSVSSSSSSIITSSSSSSTSSSVSTTSSVSSSSVPTFDFKINDGAPAIFDEEFGFYNLGASVLQVTSTERYVFYTANETKNVTGDQIYVRQGTLTGDEWIYSDRQLAVSPSETGWDSIRVNNPDVVKGVFEYQNTTYSYLMAYAGNDIVATKQFEIGLAVAQQPMGPWVKVGAEPLIAYDSDTYGSTFGAGAPSLVSFDEEGKVYVFVTFADESLTSTRVYDMDLSDLDNILGSTAHRTVSIQGLEDKDLGVLAMLNNADFTIDTVSNSLYVVRDRNPLASVNPITADSLQLAVADLSILYDIDYTWSIIDRSINDVDTVDPEDIESMGWERIFSGAFVTDAYGRVLSEDLLEIIYSSSRVATSPTDTTFEFTPAIHSFEIDLVS